MAINQTNPFKKVTGKPSLLSITLQPEQREMVESLRDHLGLKTNASVAMEALALLYDKHRRQLGSGTPSPSAEPAE